MCNVGLSVVCSVLVSEVLGVILSCSRWVRCLTVLLTGATWWVIKWKVLLLLVRNLFLITMTVLCITRGVMVVTVLPQVMILRWLSVLLTAETRCRLLKCPVLVIRLMMMIVRLGCRPGCAGGVGWKTDGSLLTVVDVSRTG